MEFETEILFLEVCETGFGCYLSITDSTGLVAVSSIQTTEHRTYRASSDLVGLAIVGLVVCCVSITVHSHDIGKHGTGAVVLVGIEEDAETLELVCMAENISRLRTLLGEPHGEAVAIEIALTVDLEFEYDLLA